MPINNKIFSLKAMNLDDSFSDFLNKKIRANVITSVRFAKKL